MIRKHLLSLLVVVFTMCSQSYAQRDTGPSGRLDLESFSRVIYVDPDVPLCIGRAIEADREDDIITEFPFSGQLSTSAVGRDGSASSEISYDASSATGRILITGTPSEDSFAECGTSDLFTTSQGDGEYSDSFMFTNSTNEELTLDYELIVESAIESRSEGFTAFLNLIAPRGGARGLRFSPDSEMSIGLNKEKGAGTATGSIIIPPDASVLNFTIQINSLLQIPGGFQPDQSDLTFKVRLGALPEGLFCESRSTLFPGCDKPFEPEPQVAIFYINGIRTDNSAAQLDYLALRRSITQAFGDVLPAETIYGYVHNPTAGTFQDIEESIEQIIDQARVVEILSDYRVATDEEKSIIRNIVLDELAASTSSAVLAKHLSIFREKVLNEGNSLIIVGHSQGNLYANLAYFALNADEQQRTRIVSVATPTSGTAGGGPYTTDAQDIIRLVFGSRPPNIANPIDLSFREEFLLALGHNFRKYYLLDGMPTRTKIVNDIGQAIVELQ